MFYIKDFYIKDKFKTFLKEVGIYLFFIALFILLFSLILNDFMKNYEKKECDAWVEEIKSGKDIIFKNWQIEQCLNYGVDLLKIKNNKINN